MSAVDRHHGAEIHALRGLGLALRNRRMYPAGSAVQERAVRQALERLRELPDPELRVEVHPDRLLLSRAELEEAPPMEPALARRLHEMRVGELRLESSLSEEALIRLVDLLLEEGPPSELGRRLENREIDGVLARTIDLERIFAEAGSGVAPGRALWDRLLLDFSAAAGQDGEVGAFAAGDSASLTEILRWIGNDRNLGAELAGFSRVDLLSIVSEQAVLAGGDDPAAALESLAAAVHGSFDAFDPEAWLEFLREPLEIEIGHGDDGVGIDLRSVVLAGLSVDQATGLIEYGFRTRGRSSPRLGKLFRELLEVHPEGDRVRERTDVPATDAERLEEIDTAEDVEPWVEADYAGTLSSRRRDAARHRAALRPRFAELNPAPVRHSALRIGVSMLGRERDPESHAITAAFVCERLPELVESGEVHLAGEAIRTLRRQAEDSSLPHELSAEAERHLAELPGSELLERLLDSLAGASGADFDVACRVLEHLRVDPAPHLLALVAEGSAVSRHEVARLWRYAPSLPVSRIERRIRTAEGRAARALTLLAADLGRPEILPALRAGLEHEDRETRRAAVGGLAGLPDGIALDPLLEALGDPALEVRIAAIRGLRRRGAAGCSERIAAALEAPNLTGRNNRRIVAALKAAEALGERSALPQIRELARPPWLFRRRRRVVTATATRVLQALEAEPAERPRSVSAPGPIEKAA